MPRSKAKRTNARKQVDPVSTGVVPIAIKPSETSSDASIPVAIQTAGNSSQAEAVIPVEVKNAKGKSIKRAAVVPISVRTASKRPNQRQSRRAQQHREQMTGDASRPERREEQNHVTQKNFVRRGAGLVMTTGQTLIAVAAQLVMTVVDIAVGTLKFLLGSPSWPDRVTERVQAVPRRVAAAVERLAA